MQSLTLEIIHISLFANPIVWAIDNLGCGIESGNCVWSRAQSQSLRKLQGFRLQSFGVSKSQRPTIVHETNIDDEDGTSAIRAAMLADWPRNAIGVRVFDHQGFQVFERLKADR